MKILIYGAGRTGLRYWESISDQVIGFLETKKKVKTFCGLPVYGLDELENVDFDEIHLANIYVETLYLLLEKNVPKDKIVVGNYKLYMEYAKKRGTGDIRFSFPLVMTRPMITVEPICSEEIDFTGSKVLAGYDYVRHMTLKLLAREINNRHIQGDIAELGVFQGEFSSLMNSLLPDRTLHLFDTFEGFAECDRAYEIDKGYTKAEKFLGKGEFANTSVEMVMAKMIHPEKCVVHKGYFPDTIPKEEKKYALVSLDCDLYAPMLAGLRYFVPRLSHGGYIMMHDYNDEDFKGNKKAIEDYEKEFGNVVKVPIPDCNGSIILSR